MSAILSMQSHLVYGHGGNSSSVFPIQRLGVEVWPININQYSNHISSPSGYQGQEYTESDISELVAGLIKLGNTEQCSALLSGYLSDEQQCRAVVDTLETLHENNPKLKYICNPVIGDSFHGQIVSDEVKVAIVTDLLPRAYAITPNRFELSVLTGMPVDNTDQVIKACHKMLELGPKAVFVKTVDFEDDRQLFMMVATQKACYLMREPLTKSCLSSLGLGDLIAALIAAGIVKNLSPTQVLQATFNAAYGLLELTQDSGCQELQLIAGQDEINNPSHHFPLKKIA
ncbi:pyridoxal kinase [Vibrio harveyi]|uniref:pyridoxal kinase n=1 Tax=Vibrio harveyi TaxID=669 RepID=UPI003D755AC9